jgi:uncharacterized protein (DUF736 family)
MMMSEHNDTNRGALFPTGDQKLLRNGPVHFEQEEEKLAVIQVVTQSGKTVFEVYQKIGAVFANTDKKQENSPDMSGTVTYEGLDWKMAGWKEESKQGLQYTSVKLTPPEVDDPPAEGEPAGGNDLDDEIPF